MSMTRPEWLGIVDTDIAPVWPDAAQWTATDLDAGYRTLCRFDASAVVEAIRTIQRTASGRLFAPRPPEILTTCQELSRLRRRPDRKTKAPTTEPALTIPEDRHIPVVDADGTCIRTLPVPGRERLRRPCGATLDEACHVPLPDLVRA